jgi:hypothetical protein
LPDFLKKIFSTLFHLTFSLAAGDRNYRHYPFVFLNLFTSLLVLSNGSAGCRREAGCEAGSFFSCAAGLLMPGFGLAGTAETAGAVTLIQSLDFSSVKLSSAWQKAFEQVKHARQTIISFFIFTILYEFLP